MTDAIATDSRIGFFGPIYVKVTCGLLLLVLAATIVGPHIAAWEYDAIHWEAIGVPPSGEHWFGTDNVGRDLFTRTMMGGRISLLIAVLATTVSFCIGLPWGAVSGYVGGTTDQVMMRIVDGMYAIPYVLVVIVLVVMLGRNIYLLFIAIGAVSWLDVSRIVRGQALVLKAAPFVASARAMGLPEYRIVVRHVVPNVLGSAIVFATLMIPSVIISESFISFLGLGVQEPMTSLGVLIADGSKNIYATPWQLAFPTGLLTVLLLLMTILGERLRRMVTGAERSLV
ncbi:MAG: ABC transporter permease [Gammaproteobacteria bacterium]|nr:ABC transporter permease [Gammaproteobacteria bacterium]